VLIRLLRTYLVPYHRLIAAVIALLVYEHSLVKADDFSRVNAAFFTMNGVISVIFFAFVAADLLVKH